jgi:hypothetical protein
VAFRVCLSHASILIVELIDHDACSLTDLKRNVKYGLDTGPDDQDRSL